ncbi:MAG: AAA family ATPase [Pseudomonadota bacterium]
MTRDIPSLGMTGIDPVRRALDRAEEIDPLPANQSSEVPVGYVRPGADENGPRRSGDASLSPFPRVQEITDRRARISSAVRRAADAKPDLDPDYLVKGWLMADTTSMIYGPSNVGKTFVALHLAAAIGSGRPWFGCRTRRRHVLYIAAEGGRAFENRVAALAPAIFDWVAYPFDLYSSDADVRALADVFSERRSTPGSGLIIVDTLARAMPAGDENSNVDMGMVIRNADKLRQLSEAHVMVVHHTGKDTSAGARGHTSLRAAVDTEIELSRDDDTGAISMRATKQRDTSAGEVTLTLKEVPLGNDADGDPVTTCVVQPLDDGAKSEKRKRPKGNNEIALQALRDAIREHGEVKSGPDYPALRMVGEETWRRYCGLKGMLDQDDQSSTNKMRWSRAKEWLLENDYARSQSGSWWLL